VAFFNPVVSLSYIGAVVNGLLRFVYFLLHLFVHRAWKRPLRNFEENPATYTSKALLYFGYKYYAYPHWAGETPEQEAHFRNQPARLEGATQCTMSVGGDLMPYKVLMDVDTNCLWEEAAAFFDADVVFANLETPMDLNKPAAWVPELMLNNMYFNGNEQLWQVFTNGGKGAYDVLSVANNHMHDQGPEGLASTLDFLNAKGVVAVGARRERQFNPKKNIIQRQGISFGFSAWTYSLNTCPPNEAAPWSTNLIALNVPDADFTPIVQEAQALRAAGAEVLVVSLHGGNAYQAFPQDHVIKNYRRIMEETGADLIIGTHPHNAQPWEFYEYQNATGLKTGLILYSPGDFIAYDIFKWCHLPMTYSIGFSRSASGINISAFQPHFWYMGLLEGKELRLFYAETQYRSGNWRSWPRKNQREFLDLLRFQRHTFPAQCRIFESP
jgi:poly-gamma-glutamate synthesis protein (capsule biosynthesis protein)